MKRVALLLLAGCAGTPDLRHGSVIESSTTLRGGVLRLPDPDGSGAIRLRGDNLVVDFGGLELVGSPDGADPDAFAGTAVIAENCRNLRVRNLKARGYKVALKFVGCDGLVLEDVDVSRNWRQRLRSTPRAEAGEDWLYGHENDSNEWLRYGAGVWIEASRRVTIRRARGRNGQNGLCLVKVDDSKVLDCDLSFMSGWGLAMWRSSRNEVAHNSLDWCMRGFSHGVYHRGQDSAGILVYEQCHDNVFAFNSATHGGDGFFLYAGNETLRRTGRGGCNDNLVYGNDFSHAAANGIEATFSTGNRFVNNRLDQCDHGIWAGYSRGSLIAGNSIRDCAHGVSIEHGGETRITGNTFERNGVDVNLWWDEDPDLLDTPYGRVRDTFSRGYVIDRNRSTGSRQFVRLGRTSQVGLAGNDAETGIEMEGPCADVKLDAPLPPEPALTAPQAGGTRDAMLPPGTPRGWNRIFVDEWGPYDFTDLRAFPNPADGGSEAEVRLLGPGGRFEVRDVSPGVVVEPTSGPLPGTLRIRAASRGLTPFTFTVESGNDRRVVRGTLLSIEWTIRVFAWKDRGPRQPPEPWDGVIAAEPVDELASDRLAWRDRPSDKSPGDFFATVSTASIELPAGRYRIRTVSDDGVRVLVDGSRVIDNWTWHGPTEDRATIDLPAGRHEVRVEHFEIDGWAELSLSLDRLEN